MQAERFRGRDLLSHTAELPLWTAGACVCPAACPLRFQVLHPALPPAVQEDFERWGILKSQGFRSSKMESDASYATNCLL